MTLSTTRPATLYGRVLNRGEAIRLHAHPGGVPFRIGRHRDHPLVIGRPRGRYKDEDQSISGTVCEVAFEAGLWGIRCLSSSHPIQINERDHDEVLPVCTEPARAARRVVVPPGLRVSIPSEQAEYHLRLTVDAPRTTMRLTRPLPQGHPSTTSRLPEPTPCDRLLLTAKFLSNNIPVDAVGDGAAAEIANGVRARCDPKARPFTAKDVEKRVSYWRGLLRERGVESINGQQRTNEVGTQLLAWGVLAPSDLRELLT